MARVALSEFRSKQLVFTALGQSYQGLAVDLSQPDYAKAIAKLPASNHYVAKVDQAVKKRNKLGLVTVNRTKEQVTKDLQAFAKQGYRYGLVEPFVVHQQIDEHYIALARTEDGVKLSYSPKGGIDIEENANSIQQAQLSEAAYRAADNTTKLDNKLAKTLYEVFQQAHMTLLEINPCLIQGKQVTPLDAAVQVDSAAQFFVNGAWSEHDIREAKSEITKAEQVVETLNAQSPASLSLKVLNPNGAFFLLLSGGGASVVVADELAARGKHSDIANYGEYSGNPSEDETYMYAKEVLDLLLTSKASKKVLLIAGGVANFTDVAKTFAGIIRALQDLAKQLAKQHVTIIVRRGGPNQAQGLKAITQCLERIDVKHEVHGPEVSLAEAVDLAIGSVK